MAMCAIWFYFFSNILTIFKLMQASFDTVCSSPLPDANLDYRDLLESTKKVFSSRIISWTFFFKSMS